MIDCMSDLLTNWRIDQITRSGYTHVHIGPNEPIDGRVNDRLTN